MPITHLILVLFILSSCANKMVLPGDYNIQLLPEKAVTQKITDLKVTYIVPQTIINSQGIGGLNFAKHCWGRDTKQERILVNFNNEILQVERRTDNGLAGSGRIYKIRIIKTNEQNNRIIILQPESMNTYQDGIILPFPLPEFDLESYLTSAVVKYDFELNSQFPVGAIKANFNRMFEKPGDTYTLNLSSSSVLMRIKIDPYRTGSKVVINAELFDMKPVSNIIDVNKNILELERRVKSIVDA